MVRRARRGRSPAPAGSLNAVGVVNDRGNRIDVNFRRISFSLDEVLGRPAQLRKILVPNQQPGTAQPANDITYLDAAVRIVRGGDGALFIFRREESDRPLLTLAERKLLYSDAAGRGRARAREHVSVSLGVGCRLSDRRSCVVRWREPRRACSLLQADAPARHQRRERPGSPRRPKRSRLTQGLRADRPHCKRRSVLFHSTRLVGCSQFTLASHCHLSHLLDAPPPPPIDHVARAGQLARHVKAAGSVQPERGLIVLVDLKHESGCAGRRHQLGH
eukprot:scaffold76934_cov60-Phaeocystis_antarctica.AAC.2